MKKRGLRSISLVCLLASGLLLVSCESIINDDLNADTPSGSNCETLVVHSVVTTPTPPAPPGGNPPAPPSPPAAPGGNGYSQTPGITTEAAQSAALARVGGTVIRTETHYPPHGGVEYKVIIVNGDYKYCVHVNAYDGSVMDYHMDQITKAGPHINNGASAAISADNAKSIAFQKAGGGVVTECNLDYKPHIDALTYHIHVAYGQYEYCIELDAATGVVYKVEQRYKP